MTDVTERLRAAIADRYRIDRELGAGGMATVYLNDAVRVDSEPSRVPQVDSVRAELSALGDLEGKR